MREIKFRAWDKSNERILSGAALCVSVQGNAFGVYKLDETNECLGNEEDFELMQYTGLKDCQGNEIYEGDIIQYTATDITGEPITYRWPVKLQEGCYLCGHRPLREILKYFKGEKLGNIYESPELLAGDCDAS